MQSTPDDHMPRQGLAPTRHEAVSTAVADQLPSSVGPVVAPAGPWLKRSAGVALAQLRVGMPSDATATLAALTPSQLARRLGVGGLPTPSLVRAATGPRTP
ncbi:MAG: hypothetical protein ABIS35_01275 [Terracoccus sp.]